MSSVLLLGAANGQAPYTTVYSFTGGDTGGANPYGALTVDGSTLYGMTFFGGTNNVGTLFQMNASGSGFQVLYSFPGDSTDGGYPYNSLALSGSTLYGMTSSSGSGNGGTLFKIGTDGSGYSLVHAFTNSTTDGSYPYGSLTLSGSTLFGMTSAGGLGNSGTVFKVNADGSGFSLLHSFIGGNDGAFPYGSLTLSGSTLFGMAYGGGSSSNGVLFRMGVDGSGYTVLHTFAGNDGANPSGSLTLSGSTLYGMTSAGGSSNTGTVFKINVDGSDFSVLHSFTGSAGDGSAPQGSLTLIDSTLYGLTSRGGDGYGTVFEINTNGGSYQILYSFANSSTNDGKYPNDSMVLYANALYGMTTAGGTGNDGTVFAIGGVPEPSTFALAAAGLAALLARGRWKSR